MSKCGSGARTISRRRALRLRLKPYREVGGDSRGRKARPRRKVPSKSTHEPARTMSVERDRLLHPARQAQRGLIRLRIASGSVPFGQSSSPHAMASTAHPDATRFKLA